jgi:hypothetical protein
MVEAVQQASLASRVSAPLGDATVLRAAADALLQEAKQGPPTHDTALTLLAADALITLSCQAVADSDAGALSTLR